MSRRVSRNGQTKSPSDRTGPLLLEQLFAVREEPTTEDTGVSLTPEENFRRRVATAWRLLKSVYFREHELDQLRRELVGLITRETPSMGPPEGSRL